MQPLLVYPKQRSWLAAVGFCALLLAAGSLSAQTGSITGQVVDANTLRPLVGAQVFISGLRIGVVTSNNGRYLLSNVPAGAHRAEVTLIGYASVTQEVTVAAGTASPLDFQLRTSAISLDEIVVTGTGVGTERRQLGQTVATVDTRALEAAPLSNVGDLLRGRVGGVFGTPSGETGAAAPIVLRGAVSLTQKNDPIIYIDGIRVNNSYQRFSSPLDQINPSDIERLEVIKGAAAATLYGTEASGGVIQIFTKRGVAGDPVFTFQMDQGFVYLAPHRMRGNYGYDRVTKTIVFSDPFNDEFRQNGHVQDYTLSAQGGGPKVQFFASGRLGREESVVPEDLLSNYSLRTNLNIQPTEKFQSRLELNVTRTDLFRLGEAAGLGQGNLPIVTLLINPAVTSPIRPYGETYGTIKSYNAMKGEIVTNQLTLGGSASYQWTPNISSDVTAGYNNVFYEEVGTIRQGDDPAQRPDGARAVRGDTRTGLTLDGKTSWQQSFGANVVSTLVVGGQSYWDSKWARAVGVRNFSSPALGTLSGGSTITNLSESFEEVINAGVYVQEQVGLWDRLFITGAVRADGNSAFGEDFGFQVYPKLGASWVVSDHDFWNVRAIEQFRLRAAYGAAGRQPGSFDAIRTWSPAARINNDPLVVPLNLGNPNLKPERSTEIEVGAELGMFGGRAGLDLVYFMKETRDGLLNLPSMPSMGFSRPQLSNVARLESSGLEASLNVTWIQRPNFSWQTSTSIATLDQKVTDLGGVAPFLVGDNRQQNYVWEGYAPGATLSKVQDPKNPYTLGVPIDKYTLLDQATTNYLKNSAGRDSLVFMGNAAPTVTGSFSSTFDLPAGFQVNATFDGAAGYIILCASCITRTGLKNEPWLAEWEKELDDPNTSTARRQEIADQYGRNRHLDFAAYMSPADYIRFSELSVSYSVAESFAQRLGASSMQVSLMGRRLGIVTKYKPTFGRAGFGDPGTSRIPERQSAGLSQNWDGWPLPPPSRYLVRVRATF